jgi:hypothetical protein
MVKLTQQYICFGNITIKDMNLYGSKEMKRKMKEEMLERSLQM